MGRSRKLGVVDETEHNVTLTKGFYLGKYEVTQAQYEAVTGSNPSEFNATGNGNRPVEKATWTEALLLYAVNYAGTKCGSSACRLGLCPAH